MRTAKRILEQDYNIDSTTKAHNYDYLYRSILAAMEVYAQEQVKNISSNHVLSDSLPFSEREQQVIDVTRKLLDNCIERGKQVADNQYWKGQMVAYSAVLSAFGIGGGENGNV